MNAEEIKNKSHLKDTNVGPCQLKINNTTVHNEQNQLSTKTGLIR